MSKSTSGILVPSTANSAARRCEHSMRGHDGEGQQLVRTLGRIGRKGRGALPQRRLLERNGGGGGGARGELLVEGLLDLVGALEGVQCAASLLRGGEGEQ